MAKPKKEELFSTTLDIVIRLAIVLILIGWAFDILKPFILPIIWGIILSVAVYPAYQFLSTKLGGRTTAAAVIMSGLMLLVIIVPMYFLGDSMVGGIKAAQEASEQGPIQLPPPGPDVAEWPVIGPSLHKVWYEASVNLNTVLTKYAPQIGSFTTKFVGALAGIGLAIIQFILSIIIAGVLMATSGKSSSTAEDILKRIDDDRGIEFLNDTVVTIRNVAKGVIGVAIIQSFLLGIGMAIAGIPAAGLWALIALVFGIIQLGVGPVAIGAIIYVFSNLSTLAAVLFTVWAILVAVSDNILKPLMMGKGAPVPILVVFLGSLGGFMNSGLIGLFVGAIIVSIAYKLVLSWMHPESIKA